MKNQPSPRRSPVYASLLLLPGLLPGCHKDKGEDTSQPYACTVVPEIRDAARSCVLDENCACGAHCEMGACAVECTSDADCEGDCDLRFGRCVDAGQGEADPMAREVSAPTLTVKPDYVTLPSEGAQRQVRVFPTDGDSGLLRVTTDEGLLVQCRTETSFGHECILQAVDPEVGQLLTLRREAMTSADPPSYAELRLYTQAGAQARVGVALGADALSAALGARSHARAADDSAGGGDSSEPAQGVYQGYLQPYLAGMELPGDDPWVPLSAEQARLPVTVELWSDGTFRLTDDLSADGVLFPGLVGQIDTTRRTIWLPSQRVAGDEALPADANAPEVLMNLSTGSLGTLSDTSIYAKLVTLYDGLSDYGSPLMVWTLSALKDEGATLGAEPPLGADAVLEGSVDERMDTPLPGEAAASAPFDGLLCSTDDGLGEGWARLTDDSGDETCLATGDLGCGEDLSPWATLPLLQWSGDQAFDVDACATDLLDVGAWGTCGDDTCTCLDAPGQAAAMAMALEDARTALLSDDYDDDALANTRLGQRLAQQWLEVATWLPTEAMGQAQYGEAAGAVDPSADIGYDGAFQAIEASLSAWDLLLHPRIATALLVLPDEVGLDPDYRPDFQADYQDDTCADNVSALDQVQDVGLPVGMLSALSAQGSAITALLRESRMDPSRVDPGDASTLLGDWLRLAMPVRGLAEGMVARAQAAADTAGEALPWQDEWDSAAAAFETTLSAAMAAENDDDNPLGIQETDLPLYGLNDQVGSSSRFFALSQNLLGTGDCLTAGESDGYATEACLAANTALTQARDAWNAEQARDWSNEAAANDQARREEAIQQQFGDPVWSLCGYPAELGGLEIMAHPELVDPETCYMPNDSLVQYYEETMGDFDPPTDCPTAAVDTADYLGHLSEAGVAEQMCIVDRLSDEIGPALQTYLDSTCKKTLDWLSGAGAWDLTQDPPIVEVHVGTAELSDQGGSDCNNQPDLDGDGDSDEWGLEGGLYSDICRAYTITFAGETRSVSPSCAKLSDDALTALNPDDYQDALATVTLECASVADAVDARRPITDPGSCEMASDCPLGMSCSEGACTIDPVQEPDPSCYRGSLGEAALQVQAAANEVEVAQAELAEYTDRYDIAMQSCFILQEGDETVADLIDQHNTEMQAMGAVKLGAKITAHVAHAAADAEGLDKLLAGEAAAPALAVEAAAESVADSMDYGMEVATGLHEALMDEAKAQTAEQQCFNDAEMNFVGAATAAQKIQTAILNLESAMVTLNNLKTVVAGDLSEGQSALQMETDRRLSPLATAYWSDEKLESYTSKLRRARRAAWLALRVVEYEQQTTLDTQRADILAARTPDELGEVLSDLQSISSTGTVNGSSPTQLLVVLSLKDHLAQLSSFDGMPDGYQDMSAEERFHWWLTDDALAVYDTDGTLLGREIPFTLSPDDGTFSALDNIPLRTDTDCAERLWSVNVSILGDDAYTGGDSTFGRVVIKKANTFYSQWCDDTDRDTTLQEASTRPRLNLLLDPYDDDWASTSVSSDATDDYTSAQITAYLGVDRAELEDESYFNGDSQQLAGRGLYGDYTIFIPEEWIATEGESTGEGLDLGAFDDILIRFDYLAVAR